MSVYFWLHCVYEVLVTMCFCSLSSPFWKVSLNFFPTLAHPIGRRIWRSGPKCRISSLFETPATLMLSFFLSTAFQTVTCKAHSVYVGEKTAPLELRKYSRSDEEMRTWDRACC